MRPGRGRSVQLLALAVASGVFIACNDASPADSVLSRLAEHRVFEPRRSLPSDHVPCDSEPSSPATLPCGDAGTVRRALQEVLPWATRIGAATDTAEMLDPGSARAIATFDVLSAAGTEPSVRRAAGHLARAAGGGGSDPDLLNDMGWAALVDAQVRSATTSALQALEHFQAALDRDPEHAPAAFNLALALEWLGLPREADVAWTRASSVTHEAGWAEEIDARQGLLRTRSGASSAEQWNTDALLLALHEALDGDRGDAPAGARVEELRAIAADRAEQGERTSFDVLDGLSNPVTRGRFMTALSHYAAGRRLWTAGSFASAAEEFELAAASLDATDPRARGLLSRARLGRNAQRVYEGRHAEAQEWYDLILSEASETSYAATRGHAYWGLGLSLARGGDLPAAQAAYREGRRMFERMSQTREIATLRYLYSETLSYSGDPNGALSEIHAALTLFRANGGHGGNLHHNLLSFAGRILAPDFPAAAVHFHREGLQLTRTMENPQFTVEALIRLAQAEARQGLFESATSRLDEAQRSLPDVPDPGMRRRLEIEFDEITGLLMPGLPVEDRILRLSRAIDYYRDVTPGKLPLLLEGRGRALLASGSAGAAVVDLQEAIASADRQLADMADPNARRLLIDARADAVDELIHIHMEAGDAEGALVLLDRSRTMALQHPGMGSDPVAGQALERSRMPDGSAVLAFAVTDRAVMGWTARRGSVVARTLAVSPEELADVVGRLRQALRTGASTDRVGAMTASLHQTLLGPFETSLSDTEELVVVPDGVLHGLPFAVLGPTPGEILDRFSIRFAPSVAYALRDWGEGRQRPAGLVFAASGSDWDRAVFPALASLPHAAEEAREVASLYNRATVIIGTAGGLVEALEAATVLHYAGHAIYREDRPELSEIVLSGSPSTLRASDIAALDLSRLRLAVLSACDTQQGLRSRAGGLSGLTWSFLAAGAGGVIGSLWAVPDESTTQLMVDVHRELAAGVAPEVALARVQRRWSLDPHAGWGWAAFRYEGEAQR